MKPITRNAKKSRGEIPLVLLLFSGLHNHYYCQK